MVTIDSDSSYFGYADPKCGLALPPVQPCASTRVDLQEDWGGVLSNLDESFFDLNGDFGIGVYNVFSTAGGDQLNDMWFPQCNGRVAGCTLPSGRHSYRGHPCPGKLGIGMKPPRLMAVAVIMM